MTQQDHTPWHLHAASKDQTWSLQTGFLHHQCIKLSAYSETAAFPAVLPWHLIDC